MCVCVCVWSANSLKRFYIENSDRTTKSFEKTTESVD